MEKSKQGKHPRDDRKGEEIIMQFPNALEGVKKIYKAEIIALIGSIVSVLAFILSLAGAAVVSAGEDAGIVSILGGSALLIVASVLAIIAFIVNIIGLNKAKADEADFKFALYAALMGVIISVLLGFASSNKALSSIGSKVSTVCSFLSTYYVCTAVANLAGRLSDAEMNARALRARRMLMIVYIAGIVMGLIAIILNWVGDSQTIVVFAAALLLISAVLDVVSTILYLKMLSRAKLSLEH